MATNTKNSPTLLDDSWATQDAKARLNRISKIASDALTAQQELTQLAQHDEHESVRLAAIKLLQDITVLEKLRTEAGPIQDTASHQYFLILAANSPSPLDETQRLKLLRAQPKAGLKQVALLTKDKTTGTQALALIEAAEELMDLSLFAASVHVRKSATLKISDEKLLQELREKVKDKDKTVFKVIEQKLAISPASTETTNTEKNSTETNSSKTNKTEPSSSTSPAKPEAKVETSKPSSPPAATPSSPKPPVVKPAPAPIDVESELPKLEQELQKTNHKNVNRLNTLRNNVNLLRKAIVELEAKAVEEIQKRADVVHSSLLELQEKNKEHQENLKASTEALLVNLKTALDDGQSHDALPAWDKIQSNISNTSGKLKLALQKQANEYKDKLNELRDWKIFASTEKKKELIAQMQHLVESKMHAADRSRNISNMHKEWKALGRSSQNEELWREFKKISDKAYEPCKDYFKQRKQLMVENLHKRREICDLLEKELESNPDQEVNAATIGKLLSDAEKSWKEYAPIEQSKIKALQKRYYGAVNQFRKLRRNSLKGNGKLKLDYISQAQVLAESEDNNKAMNEAKKLQQEWKKLGPTSYKEDRKFWEDFRAACDKIFAKRDEQSAKLKEELGKAEQDLEVLLRSLEDVAALEDELFRASKNKYQELVQQFSSAMDPRIKQKRKQLLDQFNGIKRKIDSRFKNLPDKKRVQLKQAVVAKSGFLAQFETLLLASKDDAALSESKTQFNEQAWNDLEQPGNSLFEKTLVARLENLKRISSVAELKTLTQATEGKVRKLCVDLEIRANTDTPSEDQGLRMQLQLDQLKQGFGQARPDHKANLQYAMDAELEAICFGPMLAETQQELSKRLDVAIRKLL